MLGAIIGDIVGSRFEFNNHLSKDFELFSKACAVTDDSIISLAIAKAILEASKVKNSNSVEYDSSYYSLLSELTVKYMQEIGRKYPNCGFGGMFNQWIFNDNPKPYNSSGNGAAMRVSPAGFAAKSMREAIALAKTVTAVTHNHKEGIKGAEAVVVAIYLARKGATKDEIRERINTDYYPMNFKIDDIRPADKFSVTCQGTVPQAIECFLEATSFEDAIRTAVSLGGDSDTIAAITGSIAEAYYGIPEDIIETAHGYLDKELRDIYDEWCLRYPPVGERFRVLTKYIGKLSDAASFGEWIIDNENDGSPEHPIRASFVNYSDLVRAFEKEFYQFSKAHPKFELTRYREILESSGLKLTPEIVRPDNLQSFDAKSVLALIMGAIRTERFSEGSWLEFIKGGSLLNCLKRLKDIDLQRQNCNAAETELVKDFLPENVTFTLHMAKAVIHEADDLVDEDSTIQRDEDELYTVNCFSDIGVLDESLYSFDSIMFSLTPAIQERTSEGLFDKIKTFVNTVPAIGKAADAIKDKVEYIPRFDMVPEEIKKALKNGQAEIIPCKNSPDAVYLQIRATVKGLVIDGKEYGKNRKIKDIPLGTKTVPADIASAIQCLSMQSQLNQIAEQLKEISEICELNFSRIIQGQRDDRLSMLLSSRSNFIQALTIEDKALQRQMLAQAIYDANSARAKLALQIKSDINMLGNAKYSKDMEKVVHDIGVAIITMNNAVQLSLYSYQALGERNAQLAVVKEHELFVKQVLLKEIDHKGSTIFVWKRICSSGNSSLAPRDFEQLPSKLIDSCDAFIEGRKKAYYLEGEQNEQ